MRAGGRGELATRSRVPWDLRVGPEARDRKPGICEKGDKGNIFETWSKQVVDDDEGQRTGVSRWRCKNGPYRQNNSCNVQS